MSKPTHTPEPWKWSPQREHQDGMIPAYVETADGDKYIADCDWDEDSDTNARRICAAVNACAGISTEALEAGAVKEALDALNALLLDAGGDLMDSKGTRARARAAYAKVRP